MKEVRFHTVTIIIYNREKVYQQVSKLLHDYAVFVQSRLGYPIPEQDTAVIFLILKMSTDDLGALSGKLGQIKDVSVKASTLKI